MLSIIKERLNDNKGFTLVELMAVVVIIGILLAIAIPAYSKVSESTKIKACDSNVRILQGAVLMYHANEGSYPAALANLLTATDDYLKATALPDCPVDGTAYTYTAADGTVDFHAH